MSRFTRKELESIINEYPEIIKQGREERKGFPDNLIISLKSDSYQDDGLIEIELTKEDAESMLKFAKKKRDKKKKEGWFDE